MKIFRVFLSAILCFSIFFSLLYGNKKISKGRDIESTPQYKGVITLWHIDTFEGGVGSRKNFLLKVARDFEKQEKGLLIMVISHTVESAKDGMENGDYPDMLSFGIGAKISGQRELSVNQTFNGGSIGKKIYALPWCRGGYVLISRENKEFKEDKKIILSKGEFTQSLASLLLENYQIKEYKELKPLDAYNQFVLNKAEYLLGTQRDLVRLNNRGIDVKVKPITYYNDLFQYISITTENDEKAVYCERFIKYLISTEVQKKLKEINMFSCYCEVEYQEEDFKNMQSCNNFYTVSPFLSDEELSNIHSDCINYINGDEKAILNIKKNLILS